MYSTKEIRMLRCGKGLFSAKDMVEALSQVGVNISSSTYLNKERGVFPFTAKEIRGLSTVLGLTIGEAMDIFS